MSSNKIKSLIVNECAGHDKKAHGINDYCCHEPDETKKCIYFQEDNTRRCGYFEVYVLPLETEIEVLYHAEINARVRGYELTRYQKKLAVEAVKLEAKCHECGKVFNPTSRRQKLCDFCRKQRARERTRQRVKNHRQKQGLM